jgi:hypothetical protein
MAPSLRTLLATLLTDHALLSCTGKQGEGEGEGWVERRDHENARD